MMIKQVERYSAGIKFLHWLIALVVIGMLSVSFFLSDFPERYQPMAYLLHKSFGLSVLGFMLIRLFLVLYRGKPPLPSSVPVWQRRIARLVQYGLYLLLFAMPISGWVMSVAAKKPPSFFGLFYLTLPIEPDKALAKLMNQIHVTIVWILIALILLHIAGAMKHYLIDKDRVLQSMLPRS